MGVEDSSAAGSDGESSGAASGGFGTHDGTVNILDIVQLTPPYFNVCTGSAYYTERKDFNGDGCINILDIVRLTPPVFGTSCEP